MIENLFVDINKTIAMPKRASKEIDDFMLTRYTRCLTAQNGARGEINRRAGLRAIFGINLIVV